MWFSYTDQCCFGCALFYCLFPEMFFWKCIIYFIRFLFSHNKQTRKMELVVSWWLRCIPCNNIYSIPARDLCMSLLYLFSCVYYLPSIKAKIQTLGLKSLACYITKAVFHTQSHTDKRAHPYFAFMQHLLYTTQQLHRVKR